MLGFAWFHKTEPYSDEELAAAEGREEVPADHNEVFDTISQFEACAMEIILNSHRETLE